MSQVEAPAAPPVAGTVSPARPAAQPPLRAAVLTAVCAAALVAGWLLGGSPAALAALKRQGVRRTVILTGDHERVARAVAVRVGADEVRAGLCPRRRWSS